MSNTYIDLDNIWSPSSHVVLEVKVTIYKKLLA